MTPWVPVSIARYVSILNGMVLTVCMHVRGFIWGVHGKTVDKYPTLDVNDGVMG